MGKLILPKQVASMDVIDEALKILYDQNKLGVKDVTNQLFQSELIKMGTSPTDSAGRTKRHEILRYFGLANHNYSKDTTAITKAGIDFYEAYLKGDTATEYNIIANSILNDVFGKGADLGGNTAIKSGDNELDAPKLFVKAILDYNGITKREFSFLICDIYYNKHNYEDACTKLDYLETISASLDKEFYKFNPKNEHAFGTFADPKVDTFLKTIGFCFIDKEGKYQLEAGVGTRYEKAFKAIDVFNSKFVAKKYSNPVEISIKQSAEDIKEGSDIDCDNEYKTSVRKDNGYKIGSAELDKQNNRVPQSQPTKKGRKYKVNPRLGKTEQEMVGYQCEMDSKHRTFRTKAKSGEHDFMESHHMIPMKAQVDYMVNLDRTENLICLCPNCHSQIHYGTEAERKKVLFALYAKRISELTKKTGISITKEELFDKYYK